MPYATMLVGMNTHYTASLNNKLSLTTKIVIGGGTAGIALAVRLAQNTSTSVAIVEAGAFYKVGSGNYSVLPGLYAASPFYATTEDFSRQQLADWGLITAAQTDWRQRGLWKAFKAPNNGTYSTSSINSAIVALKAHCPCPGSSCGVINRPAKAPRSKHLIEIPCPRNDNLCTRFATGIIMRRAASDVITFKVIPDDERPSAERAYSRSSWCTDGRHELCQYLSLKRNTLGNLGFK